MNEHGHARKTGSVVVNRDVVHAVGFYTANMPDSSVRTITRAPSDYPEGQEGDVLTGECTVAGIPCLGLNDCAGDRAERNVVVQIASDDQAETDLLSRLLVDSAGEASACGWCKHRWGCHCRSPHGSHRSDDLPDPTVAERVFDAMMTMAQDRPRRHRTDPNGLTRRQRDDKQ